jgi:plasmid stabilization system protein ParE
MAYRVEITAPAALDIDEAYTWLQQIYPAYAVDWYGRLDEAVQSLAEFPQRCRHAREQASVPYELRQLIVGAGPRAYRALFSIQTDMNATGLVLVLRVQYAARQTLRPEDFVLPEGSTGKTEP